MYIGNVKIDGFAGLAPMAGTSDASFRKICKEYGASYLISEMASSKALTMQAKKTEKILAITEEERPIALQLFGDDAQVMAQAARQAMEFLPDILDINMGCPAPKIAGNGGGAALMKNPKLAGEILRAVVDAVDVPVTVKFRKGWDENSINCVEFAKEMEASGASAICVHGRTRKEMYSGKADWEIIREVKKAVKIPVIANGDVVDAVSAGEILEVTQADFILIGRAAAGAPWIFREINEYLEKGVISSAPSLDERLAIMLRHIKMLCEDKGEFIGMKEARKHTGWYMKGLANAAGYRRKLSAMTQYEHLLEIADEIKNNNTDIAI